MVNRWIVSVERIRRSHYNDCVILSLWSATQAMWCPKRRNCRQRVANNWLTICVGQLSSLRANVSTQRMWLAIFNHRQHRQLAMTSPQVRPTIPRDCTRQPQGVEVTVPSRDLLSNPEKFDDIRSHIEGSTENLSLTKPLHCFWGKPKGKTSGVLFS